MKICRYPPYIERWVVAQTLWLTRSALRETCEQNPEDPSGLSDLPGDRGGADLAGQAVARMSAVSRD